MAVNASILVSSVTWNGHTWNTTSGGILRIDYSHSSQPVEFRAGTDEYPTQIFPTNKTLTVSVTISEFFQDIGDEIQCDETSNLVATVNVCGSTIAVTFANMMLVDIAGSQGKDVLSESTYTFVHVSTDGTTDPASTA